MQTRFLRHVCSWMFGLSALAILALMAVAFADVMMRSFVRPLSGAFELTEVLVGVMVFAALPFVTMSGKHVKVSLLRSLVGKNERVQGLLRWCSRVATGVLMGFLAYHLWALGTQFAQTNSRAVFADLPLAPFAYFAAVMCALSTLAALFSADGDELAEEK